MLKEGNQAPAFTLESDQGEKVALKDFKGQRVVLYFYPKDDTTGCTKEALEFNESLAQFKKHKAVVLGVSKDSIQSHQKFKTKYKLKFQLLSDPDTKACEAYGVWKEKSMYGRKYMGVERSTFIIGPDGKIEKIFPKVKVTDHVNEVLSVLQ